MVKSVKIGEATFMMGPSETSYSSVTWFNVEDGIDWVEGIRQELHKCAKANSKPLAQPPYAMRQKNMTRWLQGQKGLPAEYEDVVGLVFSREDLLYFLDCEAGFCVLGGAYDAGSKYRNRVEEKRRAQVVAFRSCLPETASQPSDSWSRPGCWSCWRARWR